MGVCAGFCLYDVVVKSSRSLSHLLMSSCLYSVGWWILIFDLSKAISRKRCKIGGQFVLITNRKWYMSFRLVPKSVTLNNVQRRNGRYFSLFFRARVQLPQFQNLLLIVYDHTKTICAIIPRFVWQNKLIIRFERRRCINDWLCA